MFWLSHTLSLFSGGWRGGGLLFHSILFKAAIMVVNLAPPPPPPKKRIQEGENAAFWPSCSFIIDFARGMGWGGGGGLWLQDCRPDPEIHDCFAAQCDKWGLPKQLLVVDFLFIFQRICWAEVFSLVIEANTTLIEYLQNKNFYFLFTQSSSYSLRLFILSNLGNDDN